MLETEATHSRDNQYCIILETKHKENKLYILLKVTKAIKQIRIPQLP